MDLHKEIDTSNLHHAYILEDSDEVFGSLQEIIGRAYQDAEVYTREFDSLGIEDSRELTHLANMRSLGTQLFIYRARSWSREAQNALLKLLEEPPHNTHFFFCVAGVCDVLPTLRSRVWIIREEGDRNQSSIGGMQFLGATQAERIALLEPVIKNKDVQEAEALLRDVEVELHARMKDGVSKEALQHIIDVRRVLHDKGASLKVLLESVALIVPRLS